MFANVYFRFFFTFQHKKIIINSRNIQKLILKKFGLQLEMKI
jgi:hypothetical protein